MMFKLKFLFFINLFFCFSAGNLLALDDFELAEKLDKNTADVVKRKIRDVRWLADHDLVINAVLAQNAQNLSTQEIHLRDKTWQESSQLTPFKRSLQEDESGLFIQSMVKNSKVFSEIFITDNQGANVSAYPATSDYWQGDERKWIQPFREGNIYIGSAEFDQSSQQRSIQISIPIKYQTKIIGVLVAGIKMSFIEYKALKQLVNIDEIIDKDN